MRDYVLSLSYGKDSLACIGAIKELGWPLTRIVHAEVWATDTIPADLPPMVEFKNRADQIIKDMTGITVVHYSANCVDSVFGDPVTYEDCFYRVLRRGKFAGTIKGFPLAKGCWCKKLKLNAFSLIDNLMPDSVFYLGIASDEPVRLQKLPDNKISPLAALSWTEKDCFDWCFRHDLVSPVYLHSARSGCWFCHCQPISELRFLRSSYPALWELLLKWDKDSPVAFRSDGRTVHDLDQRFSAEDQHLIAPDLYFRWDMLFDPLLNYRLF